MDFNILINQMQIVACNSIQVTQFNSGILFYKWDRRRPWVKRHEESEMVGKHANDTLKLSASLPLTNSTK